jgi:hypothetical protein
LINCEVTALEENLVSWFLVTPTYSSINHPTFTLLTVGFQTYSSDTRQVYVQTLPQKFKIRSGKSKK